MIAGAESVEEAQSRHLAWFGFEPLHPGEGTWSWDAAMGGLVSSLYGSSWNQQQPDYDPARAQVGALKRVSHADLGMQFEDDGLRSTVRWKLK